MEGMLSPERKEKKKKKPATMAMQVQASLSIAFNPKQGKQKHCAMNQTNRPSASRTPSFSPLLEGRHTCMM
jgi:hypothetical protein